MQSNNKKKICVVVTSLGIGGAERSAALLTQMLESLEYEVHLVTIVNRIELEYSGTLLNLGLLKQNSSFTLLRKCKQLFRFKRYLNQHQFDWVIDNRTKTPNIREFIIAKFLYDLSKTIYVVRSYNVSNYFPRSNWVTQYILRKLHAVVGVSQEICEIIKKQYQYPHTTCIYNPVASFKTTNHKPIEEPYVLAYGRLVDAVKNYSLLIDAYAKSALAQNQYKLIILGSGKDQSVLKSKVEALKLTQHVLFKPFESNPYAYVKNAYFVCLTSRYEGFPRTLVESLSLGVPVVSVDCKSGPKELIMHKKNGLLVENFNAEAFAEAMNSFIFDKNLYELCKYNAPISISHLKLDVIANKWKQLLEQPSSSRQP